MLYEINGVSCKIIVTNSDYLHALLMDTFFSNEHQTASVFIYYTISSLSSFALYFMFL